MTFSRLRSKHPRLIYQDFEVKPDGKNLLIEFDFLLKPDIRFRPKVSIPLPPYQSRSNLDASRLDLLDFQNLAFHLGLVEAISYWKAACPPEFVVKAGYLSPDQIARWKHLFIHGLGEFFYRNKIDFTAPNFLTIVCTRKDQILTHARKDLILTGGDLILVGGGKDSIVTLETLKQLPGRRTAMMVNPGPNSLSAAALAGYKNPIIVTRKIDSRLLQLNKQGYLNGHTPFSAYLAFLGILVAYLHGYKNVISSNELGAGEASLIYKSMEINHQYSKSFGFEKLFRRYVSKYLSSGINYFSFLRPLYEFQIAKLFSSLTSSSKYDSSFVSCNAGRGKSWCGLCPKCGFSYLSLFPFMSAGRLKNIFGRNLFEVPKIQKHILDLVGLGKYKPFDCVGTKEESILAVCLSIQKLRSAGAPVPEFLSSLERSLRNVSGGVKFRKLHRRIMGNWSNRNFLPPEYARLLKRIHD